MSFGKFGLLSPKTTPRLQRRVIEAASDTFKALALNPGLGAARKWQNSRLRDVRFFPVSGFENYLVFYRATPEGIEVLHVYHGARNLDRLLKDE